MLFSVHGIRTLGEWQGALTAAVEPLGWKHEPFRFGRFSLPRFLHERSRRRIVEEFHDWYFEKTEELIPSEKERRKNRPSIIAHSFGSYIVGETMLKYREVRFDKIVLCGSILPRSFDWLQLLARNQVWRVRNEFGLQDRWARLVGKVVPRTGESGFSGFDYDTPCIEAERFDYFEHSDYFKIGHCQTHWVPFLQSKSLEVSLRHGSDIDTQDRFLEIFKITGRVDSDCYAHLPGYGAVEISDELALAWVGVCPDIYTFLYDDRGDRVIGYVNAMPLRDHVLTQVLDGRRSDNEITADDLIPFDRGDEVHLYLMSVAVEPGARKTGQGVYQEGFERLVSGVFTKLIDYHQRFGTRVKRIGAVGWTPEGRQICEALRLEPQGSDPQGHPTYSLIVDDSIPARGRLGGIVHRLKRAYAG